MPAKRPIPVTSDIGNQNRPSALTAHRIKMDGERISICRGCIVISLLGVLILPFVSTLFPNSTQQFSQVIDILKAALFTAFGYLFGSSQK